MTLGNNFINFILLTIVIGLSAVTLLKPELLPSQRIEKIANLDISSIHTIIINNADQSVKLLKENGRWFVDIDNKKIFADKKKIVSILNFPQKKSLSIGKASAKKLVTYGLDDSKLSVTYNDTTIKIGDSEPLAIRHYILSNNKISIADDSYYRDLLLPATSFVSPFIIQPGQKVTNSKILWKKKPSIQLPKVKNEDIYKNWQRVTAEKIKKYEDEETIAIILVQINYRTILEFSIAPSKNTFKLVRKDLGIVYLIPRHYMADLLTFSSPHLE